MCLRDRTAAHETELRQPSTAAGGYAVPPVNRMCHYCCISCSICTIVDLDPTIYILYTVCHERGPVTLAKSYKGLSIGLASANVTPTASWAC